MLFLIISKSDFFVCAHVLGNYSLSLDYWMFGIFQCQPRGRKMSADAVKEMERDC